MKNKKLKKMFQAAILKTLLRKIEKLEDFSFLNDFENDQTQGGAAAQDCPRLNRKTCNPYGECSINITLRKRKKPNRQA